MSGSTFILTYYHTRNIFNGPDFKPWVKKWFKDVRFMGTVNGGNYGAEIRVSNWEEVKDKLPERYQPEKFESNN